MKNLSDRRSRYLADDIPVRLGGIAANLARVASSASNPANRPAILGMIEESKWFIEWAAPSLEIDIAARLAEIQVSLAMIESRINQGMPASEIADQAACWSEEILNMSGLLDQAISDSA